jgi:hypothetical protein
MVFCWHAAGVNMFPKPALQRVFNRTSRYGNVMDRKGTTFHVNANGPFLVIHTGGVPVHIYGAGTFVLMRDIDLPVPPRVHRDATSRSMSIDIKHAVQNVHARNIREFRILNSHIRHFAKRILNPGPTVNSYSRFTMRFW